MLKLAQLLCGCRAGAGTQAVGADPAGAGVGTAGATAAGTHGQESNPVATPAATPKKGNDAEGKPPLAACCSSYLT